MISGGQALAQMLQAFEVGPMYGMGGFQLLPFYDAVRRLGLMHTLINDERCGIFAADAYAKISGRVGVCDATLGPGATNLVTGLVEALNAGSPLVVLVGDSHRDHSWKNMTQESRQMEILRPACKELIRVEAIQRIPELVRRAFSVATSGRPGPVVLDIPEDICHASYPFDADEFAIDPIYQAAPALRCRPDGVALQRAADLLAQAQRPLILAGGGVHISQAAATLQAFARAHHIPVAHTMTGKGAIACSDALNAGLFGRYDRIANSLIEQSDCLLVAGCKLGEIATKRYSLPLAGKPLIHIDIVAEEFGRTTMPALRARPSLDRLGRAGGGHFAARAGHRRERRPTRRRRSGCRRSVRF
jgi:acetolactate synthase-1/2/3 large subunit